jgi:fructokinase
MQTPVTPSVYPGEAGPGEADPCQGGLTVIGESLVDIIHDPFRNVAGSAAQPAAHPGGSPLNVAVGCSRLELQTTLVTHYAEDPYGAMIQEHVASNGVTVINGGSTPTSTAAATLGADGAAEYDFAITWDLNGAALAALAAVENSTHVHTGSIAAVLSPGSKATYALVAAARANATVSFDPNCRPAISPDVEAAPGRLNCSWPPATSSRQATKT